MDDHRLTPQVKELVRASKSIIATAYSHEGLQEKDCEAVLFYALELLNAIEPHCEENHRHEAIENGLPYLVPESRLLRI